MFITRLQQGSAGSLASTLAGPSSPTYYCRLVGSNSGPCADRGYNAPGPYPINFFVPNPYVADLTVTDDNSYANYNALQVDVKQRPRRGLTLSGSYTWSKALGEMAGSDQTLTTYYRTIRNFALNKAPITNDRRHAFRAYGTYELPFGKGRSFDLHNGVLNRIVGGWTIGSIFTLVSGGPSMLGIGTSTSTRTVNVNQGVDPGASLAGLSLAQLRDKLLQDPVRVASGAALQRADASLLAADGRANSQYLAMPITPGQFGQFLYIYGPWYFSFDSSINKDVPVTERVKFTIQAEILNALNHPEFGLGTVNVNSTAFGQVTGTANSAREVQLRAYLRW